MNRYFVIACIYFLLMSSLAILLPAAATEALGAPSENITASDIPITGEIEADNGTVESGQPQLGDHSSSVTENTASENASAEQPPVTNEPVSPATGEETSAGGIFSVSTIRALLLIGPSIMVILALGIYFIWKNMRVRKLTSELSTNADQPGLPSGKTPIVTQVTVKKETAALSKPAVKARLVLPGGNEMRLISNNMTIGRAELARVLSLDDLVLISRKHFIISYLDGSYSIEDAGSKSGISVNGSAVKSSEIVALRDGDIIQLAGSVELQFRLL